MGQLHTASDIWHPPIRSLRGLSRGMLRLYGLVETEVANDLIDRKHLTNYRCSSYIL